jgi:hypothetical protein
MFAITFTENAAHLLAIQYYVIGPFQSQSIIQPNQSLDYTNASNERQ